MRSKYLGILIFTFLVAFIGLASWTFSAGGFPPDRWALNWAVSADEGLLFSIMSFFSALGSSESILAFTLAVAAFFLYKRYWDYLILFLTVSFGGVVVNSLLKFLFHRERPGEMQVIEVFDLSLNIPSYSFPSGHTMRSTILICFMMYLIYTYVRKSSLQYILYALSLFFMVAVALSRVFLDAHFVSDVLGALTISVVWFCSVVFVYLIYMERKKSTERQRN